MSDHPLELTVGLGNPGPQHDSKLVTTPALFSSTTCARLLAARCVVKANSLASSAASILPGAAVRVLFPTTFMNRSGKSVAAVCNFYKIDPANMLVAYDEIDFEVGVTRFKQGGGHGGHNGIRDIISALGGNRDFYRLRIGVGHPGHKSMVANYVLNDPSRSEADAIMTNIEDAIRVMPKAVNGEWEAAMRLLHRPHSLNRTPPDSQTS